MDGILDFIEKHKYGITLAVVLHLIVFVCLNLYKVSNPVEMPQRKVQVEIEADDYEVSLTPEEIEALIGKQNPNEEIRNIISDNNDDREKSYDNYSKFSTSDKSAEERVRDFERQAFEDAKNVRDASGEKIIKDFNSDVKIYGGENNSNSTNASSSPNAYAGKTVLSYDLKDRKPKDNNDWHIRNPGYRCKGSGKVVVIIKVDKFGLVKEAKLDETSSSGYSSCMVENAIKYALLSKFNYKENADQIQTGRIFYNFIAQ